MKYLAVCLAILLTCLPAPCARVGGAVAAGVYLQSSADLPAINDGSKYTYNFHYMNANAPSTAAYSEMLHFSGGAAANLNIGITWDNLTSNTVRAFHTGTSDNPSAPNGGAALSGNTWYWIGAVYDGTNLKLYINGTQQASVAGSNVDRTDLQYRAVVFALKSGATYLWEDDGNLECLSWWPSTALTAGEMASLAGGKHPQAVHASGLYGYWPLRGDDSPERNEVFNNLGMSLVASPAQLKHWAPAELFFQGLR